MRKLIPGTRSYAFGSCALLLVVAIALPPQKSPQAKSKPAAKTGAKVAAKAVDGRKAFASKCAPCHGDKGQGGAGYRKPLVGDRSVSELAKFIGKTMPPGAPCAAPEAAAVAAFVHSEFYSPLAQERNRPARVSLARLTVRQFRNAVADLVGGFQPTVPQVAERGLKAEYFKGRYFDGKNRVIQRLDPVVKFNFGTGTPTPEGFDDTGFSIVWTGSLLAPETGEYEFVVRSDHAVRFWLNGQTRPFIDAWVKSGKDEEFRGSMTLLGGRAYPVRLEFSKANQGVDDKKKPKPQLPAFIELCWKRPRLAQEPIPVRNLLPAWSPPTYVVANPFPADDRSIGYERGNSVSKAWDEATTTAALEASSYIAKNLNSLAGTNDGAGDRKDKARAYCRSFVERAFRKPLTPETQKLYIDRQFEAASTVELAVKRSVILALKSPRFLYREIGAGDGYLAASQLSFALWDTVPDPALLQAASAGQLASREQVAQQAERMVRDPRAWNKLREFLMLWLKVDEVPDLVKSAKRYPDFDDHAATDLRSSLEIFLENTAWSANADYRELILSPDVYLNGRLAKLYGASLPAGSDFQKVALDGGQRAGVLTQPYMLSRLAYLDNSSPIHRGVLVARNFLGRTLQAPPAAFAPLAPGLHPSLTTRQRVEMQTKPAACNSCHAMINPLGFSLEKFDAIGRLRDKDNGKPVDSSGSYVDRTGSAVKFAGPTELAKYLANSDEAKSAFAEKLFQHLTKQPVLAYGPKMLPGLRKEFAAGNYNIRKLMAASAVGSALRSAP